MRAKPVSLYYLLYASFLDEKGMKVLNCGGDVGWRSGLLSFKEETNNTTGVCVCVCVCSIERERESVYSLS